MSYVTSVADLFSQSGHTELLSATAYTTIAEWEKEGVPLDLIRSIIVNITDYGLTAFEHLADLVQQAFADWLSQPPNA